LMGYDYGNWGTGLLVVMVAMMLLFWLLLSGLIWARLSRRSGVGARAATSQAPPGPDDVLADRFARGEIDEEELRRRRSLLNDSSGPRT
jgi:putative membrane protein